MVADSASIRQSILYDDRRGADESVTADTAELVDAGIRPNGCIIFDQYMAGERRKVGENDVVPNSAIMGDVRLGHEQIVRTDLGYIATHFGATMDRGEFAEGVPLAGEQPASFALVLQVVRDLAGGYKWEEYTAPAEL